MAQCCLLCCSSSCSFKTHLLLLFPGHAVCVCAVSLGQAGADVWCQQRDTPCGHGGCAAGEPYTEAHIISKPQTPQHPTTVV
jgi:hypothetical protein